MQVITGEKFMQNDQQAVTDVVEAYFRGSYYGDELLLRQAFHPQAIICGNFNDRYVEWDLNTFIERVKAANSHTVEAFNKSIIGLDINHNIAMVKAKVIAAGEIFTDYISLLKINGSWCIRHKGFTNQSLDQG
jgi:hypothetical protein